MLVLPFDVRDSCIQLVARSAHCVNQPAYVLVWLCVSHPNQVTARFDLISFD